MEYGVPKEWINESKVCTAKPFEKKAVLMGNLEYTLIIHASQLSCDTKLSHEGNRNEREKDFVAQA